MRSSEPLREQDVLEALRVELGAAPSIDLAHHPLRASFESGILTVQGELPSIAAKKTTLGIAARIPGSLG